MSQPFHNYDHRLPRPLQQQPNSYGNPYQSHGIHGAGGPNNTFGAYGNIINDPAAQMGFQVGQTAFKHGQEYVEQNFSRYVNVSALKHYFNVSNAYVVNKLILVLFPGGINLGRESNLLDLRAKKDGFTPREDLNSPDLYIPVMAIVTYIILCTFLAGIRGAFQPELLGYTASTALVIVIIEILGLKLACYLLSISNESQLLDLVAYSGYKFVGIIVSLAVGALLNGAKGASGWLSWLIFGYVFLANAFFLLRSLKYVLLPEKLNRQ